MSNLYIDITELYTWSGKLTGVPRVMNEISLRYAGDTAVVFVYWEGQSKQYQKVDIRSFFEQQDAVSSASIPAATTQKYYKTIAKRIKHSSNLANKTIDVGVSLLRKVPREGEQKALVAVDISGGDKLFILADWHGSDTNFIEYIQQLKLQDIQLIQICYDMLPIATPQYSGHATTSFTNYAEKIYPLCDKIITISRHTKKDLLAWFAQEAVSPPLIEVMRLGDDFKKTSQSQPTDEGFTSHYEISKAYVLCVGTIEARKNHTLLYYAYKLAADRGITLPTLVIVGRKGWLAGDICEIMSSDPTVKDKFVFLQNATDNQLGWLYEHCLFSVYPSFYEGWGLPVAESIAYGVPCLASNSSSIPEIAGDLIDYFTPTSPDECLRGMERLAQPTTRKKARLRVQSYHPVTWDDSIAKLRKMVG